MLSPGTQIGDYTVEAYLDEGGMAHVYQAVHTSGSKHALKLLHLKDPDIRRRLIAEGKMLSALRHPNIVPVTDVVEYEGRPGLVMELVDGVALDMWMNAERRPWAQREAVIHGLIDGLAHAHQAGIVHRDLQPANILVATGADGLPEARIIDFGLAKQIRADSTTRTGSTMGTPGYMAPEQIRDSKNIDARADIFALGCLIYVLVCECEPFDGEDLLDIYNATATGRYHDPEELAPPYIDRAFLRAIEGCLKVDRDARLPHADAVRAVLEGEEPVFSEEVSLVSEATLPPFRENRGKWIASALVAVAAFVATWMVLMGG